MTFVYILVVFIAFSLIIIVHEFGHLIAGKIFGVRVDVFSVGIGKRLFGIKLGETDYRVSLFPIGGYCAFAGISDTEGAVGTGAPDEFPSKPVWQRMIIAFAGPLFNLITGMILAILLFTWGVQFTAPSIGGISGGSPAEIAGLQVGDEVVRIDGSLVNGFSDIRQEIALSSPGDELQFEILRDDKKMTLTVVSAQGENDYFPTIGITPPSSNRVMARGNPLLLDAGFEDNDILLSIGGKPIPEFNGDSVVYEQLRSNPGITIEVVVSRNNRKLKIPVTPEAIYSYSLDAGIMPPVDTLVDGSPAQKAGMKVGDYIYAIDNIRIEHWKHLQDVLAKKDGEVRVTVLRNGKELSFQLTPMVSSEGRHLLGITRPATDEGTIVTWVKEGSIAEKAGLVKNEGIERFSVDVKTRKTEVVLLGGAQVNYTARIDDSVEPYGYYPLQTSALQKIVKAGSFGEAISRGFVDCIQIINKTYLFLAKLLSAKLSPTLVSGPIGIVHISYKVLAIGFTFFLHFLVLISINLAVVNLLPLPVLDGGNIVLMAIEWIKGKPLSQKVQGIIINVGIVLILGIFLLATGNDIYRMIFGF